MARAVENPLLPCLVKLPMDPIDGTQEVRPSREIVPAFVDSSSFL